MNHIKMTLETLLRCIEELETAGEDDAVKAFEDKLSLQFKKTESDLCIYRRLVCFETRQ